MLLKVLGICFAVAFWSWALIFVGGFPVRQGSVLVLLLVLIVVSMTQRGAKPVRFVPYWVRISPNWFEILTDFKLISAPDEWGSILQSLRSSSDYNILRDDVLFTVVQQHENLEHTLIFWNQHQTFGSEFELIEDMAPIQFANADWYQRNIPPAFFIRPFTYERNVAGYSLGIKVRNWWWENVKDSCPVPVAVNTNALTSTVELTLATLPLAEFDIYRNPPNRWSDKYMRKTESQIRKRRDELRGRLGWIDKTLQIEELSVRVPVFIESKYFSIEHRDV